MRGRDNNDQKSFSIVLPVAYEVFQPFFFLFGFFDDEEDGQTKRRKVESEEREAMLEIAHEVRTKEQEKRKRGSDGKRDENPRTSTFLDHLHHQNIIFFNSHGSFCLACGDKY